jgi:hypothetical protein
MAATVQPMSVERGRSAAVPITRPLTPSGGFGVLVLIGILRLVLLIGWRDEGRPG